MQTLIKNTRAYQLLKAEAAKNRLSHAYLLLLDDSRNLRAALKLFAKVLLGCDEEKTENEKRLSSRIDSETFTDCLFFPEPDKKFVVEDAERVSEACMLQPMECDKKIIVISDFADANVASQNKLLKLLEEPPQGVVFLLGATTSFPLLQTVLSRVAKLEIPPFQTEEILSFLRRTYEHGTFLETDFALCAAACGGSVGAAQNTLEGGEYKALIEDAFSLCLAPKDKLPTLIRRLGETKQKKTLLFLLRVLFRDALLLKTQTATSKTLLLQSEQARLKQIADKFTCAALLYAQDELSKAEQQTFFNAVFAQCLEVLMAKIHKNNAESAKIASAR